MLHKFETNYLFSELFMIGIKRKPFGKSSLRIPRLTGQFGRGLSKNLCHNSFQYRIRLLWTPLPRCVSIWDQRKSLTILEISSQSNMGAPDPPATNTANIFPRLPILFIQRAEVRTFLFDGYFVNKLPLR